MRDTTRASGVLRFNLFNRKQKRHTGQLKLGHAIKDTSFTLHSPLPFCEHYKQPATEWGTFKKIGHYKEM